VHVQPVRISVWSDYVCPFCYLVLPVLDALAGEMGEWLALD
jgi:predicted DsbA family dithiol-disulfide isomerase